MPACCRRFIAIDIESALWGSLLAPLNDHEIPAFHLRHHSREDGVDQGINNRIAREVMGNMDLKALVGGDRGRKCVDERRERWDGLISKLAALTMRQYVCSKSRCNRDTQIFQRTNIPFHLLGPFLGLLIILDLLDRSLSLFHGRAGRCEEASEPSPALRGILGRWLLRVRRLRITGFVVRAR